MRENKDTAERREEFVEAAEKLFKENGVVETTINAIVKELDVAKGLFYYYFQSKDDVIDAISEKYNQSFRKALQRAMHNDDYDERLEQYLESVIVSFKTMWNNLHGESEDIDLSILATRTMEEAKATASSLLRDLLEEGNASSILDIHYPKYYAEMIISGIADLIGRNDADMDEIRKMIRDLIERSRKEK